MAPGLGDGDTAGRPPLLQLLEPRNVLRRFQTVAGRLGLEGVGLHTLRHSAASFLLAAGTHTEVVQEHLGHSSYAITTDISSHVAPERGRPRTVWTSDPMVQRWLRYALRYGRRSGCRSEDRHPL